MARELTYTTKALKGLRKMPKKQAQKMIMSLEHIAADEVQGLDIKKLKNMDGFRIRIGDYRAVYTIDMVIMNVENVGPRGGIYKGK